ncbi:cytochrome c/c1 heme-lyase [Xylariaceae sp. FL0016]|nr:cytochrome c/c1 heme-lyase [Xylariaceae sp. FL0016]
MSTDSQPKDPAAACPVDHKSREAWLSQARAAGATSDSSPTDLPPSHPPVPPSGDAQSCPVDHGAREVWMQQARAAEPSQKPPTSQPSQQPSSSSWSSYLPRLPFWGSSSSPSASSSSSSSPSTTPSSRLGIDREISTIPRASLPAPASEPASGPPPAAAPPLANNEQETGADARSGNWIYPSEKMFFEAMKRKGHDPRTSDMRTIVPIHNAVNERAWAEIKEWEGPWVQGSRCDGPRLHSFSGLSTQLSPKARFNTFLGYQAPFDRHDWVVDRCGKEIDYVIDFYTGRRGPDGKLSFYLDVRPKLNSWEGVKMRAYRAAGLA